MSSTLDFVFVDEQLNVARSPTELFTIALPSNYPDPEPTEAENKAFRQQAGLLAAIRAIRAVKRHADDWSTLAAAARDAFADEFAGEDLTDDLFAAFADEEAP